MLPFAMAVIIGGVCGAKIGADVLSQQTVRRILVSVLLLAALKRVVELLGAWV
jgi:uncharacterized membrane protein YfcA